MRLSPIEKPRGLVMWFAYRAVRKQFGKVISPLKAVYARVPGALMMSYHMGKLFHGKLTLDQELVLLIGTRTATLNGCHFCVDIGKAIAMQHGLSLEKAAAIESYETDPRFSERERAALRYTEEATRTKRASDETFATLKEHFSDREIAEITIVNAIENYYNLVNGPLGIESDGLCVLVEKKKGRAPSTAGAHS